MPSLFEHNLITIGNGTVGIITEPWIQYRHPKAGDKLEVIVNEELRIRPKRERRVIEKK